MHEISLATVMLEIVRSHVPDGSVLRSVRMVAGPLRSIEPLSMEFAWRAVTTDAGMQDVHLDLKILPWTLRCPDCGKQWQDTELNHQCACGCGCAFPIGGNELQVTSIEVDESLKGETSCKSR
jgi:hydrogenase nickel incorporation protein HypA/HybF